MTVFPTGCKLSWAANPGSCSVPRATGQQQEDTFSVSAERDPQMLMRLRERALIQHPGEFSWTIDSTLSNED